MARSLCLLLLLCLTLSEATLDVGPGSWTAVELSGDSVRHMPDPFGNLTRSLGRPAFTRLTVRKTINVTTTTLFNVSVEATWDLLFVVGHANSLGEPQIFMFDPSVPLWRKLDGIASGERARQLGAAVAHVRPEPAPAGSPANAKVVEIIVFGGEVGGSTACEPRSAKFALVLDANSSTLEVAQAALDAQARNDSSAIVNVRAGAVGEVTWANLSLPKLPCVAESSLTLVSPEKVVFYGGRYANGDPWGAEGHHLNPITYVVRTGFLHSLPLPAARYGMSVIPFRTPEYLLIIGGRASFSLSFRDVWQLHSAWFGSGNAFLEYDARCVHHTLAAGWMNGVGVFIFGGWDASGIRQKTTMEGFNTSAIADDFDSMSVNLTGFVRQNTMVAGIPAGPDFPLLSSYIYAAGDGRTVMLVPEARTTGMPSMTTTTSVAAETSNGVRTTGGSSMLSFGLSTTGAMDATVSAVVESSSSDSDIWIYGGTVLLIVLVFCVAVILFALWRRSLTSAELFTPVETGKSTSAYDVVANAYETSHEMVANVSGCSVGTVKDVSGSFNDIVTKSGDDTHVDYSFLAQANSSATDSGPPTYSRLKKFDNQVSSALHFRFRILFHELEFGDILGRGAYGVVSAARWHGSQVAVKRMIREDEEYTTALLNELDVMLSLRPHPNVVGLTGFCSAPDPLCVITEYVSNGSLEARLEASKSERALLPLSQKIRYLTQVARGMLHLASEYIVHKDLAARNVLISGGDDAKVADFGLARTLDTDNDDVGQTKSDTGPLRWMAPESLRKDFSEKSDAWMFSALALECFAETVPFASHENYEVATYVRNLQLRPFPDGLADVRKAIAQAIPTDLLSILESCCEFDPKVRPRFAEIVRRIEPVFQQWGQ